MKKLLEDPVLYIHIKELIIMKVNRIIFSLFVITTLLLNSCECYFGAKIYMSFRYDGKYTGIDTLINIDGYYSIPGSTLNNDKVSFYRDGLVISPFSSKRLRYLSLKNNDPHYYLDSGIIKLSSKNNDSLYYVDSGIIKDSIQINSIDGYGLYKLCNDTIKAQLYWSTRMGALFVTEVWYKIIAKDKLLTIKYEDIRDKTINREKFNNQVLHFYPAWRPDSTDNWLRNCLREKGARK